MIIDGRNIAEHVYTKTHERVIVLGYAPVLTIITCAPNFETQKYLELKKKKAVLVGIQAQVIELPISSITDDFIEAIKSAADSDGVIVQLPLPEHIDVGAVLEHVPFAQDVDALNTHTTSVLSPVVGAIKEILGTYEITPFEKFVTVIGSGRLVGLPAYRWFIESGAHVSMVTRGTEDIPHYTKNADIIVSGAGTPSLITQDMIKEGAIILDAGTSEEEGELRGDAHPDCAQKASLFTPVPGGIGPITIAKLLSNVVDCAERKHGVV